MIINLQSIFVGPIEQVEVLLLTVIVSRLILKAMWTQPQARDINVSLQTTSK